jgi:hypothetical protein
MTAARYLPSGVNLASSETCWLGTASANGEWATAVSAPLVPTSNSDTDRSGAFGTARSSPSGLNATVCGPSPVGNGDPATGVRA